MKKILIPFFLVLLLSIQIHSEGEWVVGFHYSKWSVNIIRQIIEDNVTDAFDDFDTSKGDLTFNSNGNNFGFEISYFPKGKEGSFSIGLSYERNNFKGKLTGNYTDKDNFGNKEEVVGEGFFDLRPHSFNINLFWDLWPKSRVHPYVGFGFGIGPLNGEGELTTTTTTHYHGYTLIEETKDEKTLKEAINELDDEGEGSPFTFFPIIHLKLGLKGEIVNNLYAFVELAIYDGTLFRGGILYRF